MYSKLKLDSHVVASGDIKLTRATKSCGLIAQCATMIYRIWKSYDVHCK